MYNPPLMPHEIDAHPDGGRIRATLEEVEREHFDTSFEAEEALESQRREAESDAEDLLSELSELHEAIETYLLDEDSRALSSAMTMAANAINRHNRHN